MLIDQAIIRHDNLDLPDPVLLATLPHDLVAKLTVLTDRQASAATDVAGKQAAAAAAREDRFRAKADLDTGESRSVVDPGVTEQHLDALGDRHARALKREKTADADVARAQRIHTEHRQVVTSVTRHLNGTRTFKAPSEKGGAYQSTADRGRIAGYDLTRIAVSKVEGDAHQIMIKQRTKISDLKVDLTVEDSAPPKPDTVKRMLRSQVVTARTRGKIGFSKGDGQRRGPSIDWPKVALPAEPAMNSNGDRVRVIDTEAVLSKLFGDEIIAELEAAVDAEYATTEVVRDPHEKARNIKAIKAKILQAERIECAAIWKLIESGATDIFFRPDTNPRAILGVE